MRVTRCLLFACTLFAVVGLQSAQGERSPQWRLCTGKPGIEWNRQVAACTSLIESGRETRHDQARAYITRGVVYAAKGDLDRARADFTAAIGLDPKYASAYNSRGLAWHDEGDLDRAIADFTEAIRINPLLPPGNPDITVYNNRGRAYTAKGDLDRAIADFTEAIRLDPKDGVAYAERGRANLYSGALPKALADLTQASELDPKYAYAALWLDIVRKRSNLPSRIADVVKQIDITHWPAPVIRLYLGQLTLQAVLAAADDPDAITKKGQVCEANFYGGELVLQQGRKDEAKRLLGLAAADCPKRFIEHDSAIAELKALGSNQ